MRLPHPHPRTIRRINGYMTLFWFGMIIPTVLLWSKSILWVAFLSIYANAATHYSAYAAERSEVQAVDVKESIEADVDVEVHPPQDG